MKVFLGGTTNESTWRETLIRLLTVDHFNPVVDDWTPDCMDEEIQQRELCDICLYVITPKIAGVYAIAEVVDDSNKRPSKTVLVLLRQDGDTRFTEAQWHSLGAVKSMVQSNGAVVLDSLERAAIYLNNRRK
jgi:hypothetical protein